jgi:hypothetical protein
MKQLLSIIMEEINKQNSYMFTTLGQIQILPPCMHTACMCISYRGGVQQIARRASHIQLFELKHRIQLVGEGL